MTGQVNSALRYLSDDQGGGILPLSDDVMEQLKEKHPEPQGVQLGSLLFGPIKDVPDTLYYEINGDMVRDAALRTKGSGGPSGVDANGFRRILTCKSFKRSGTELYEAIASMTKRLCTEYVDPRGLEAILANRFIPLDKGEGAVRPIGVGEEYVDEKVEEWVAQVTRLAEFATTQPQSSYAAFVFGLRHRWTYFLRTLPDIAPFLEPLERAIADLLVPAITEHVTTQEERDLLELPVRLGGLGLVNPARTASQEYEASVMITGPHRASAR